MCVLYMDYVVYTVELAELMNTGEFFLKLVPTGHASYLVSADVQHSLRHRGLVLVGEQSLI